VSIYLNIREKKPDPSFSSSKGGKVLVGGKVLDRPGNYVQPTIISIAHDKPVVQQENFVPILHTIKVKVKYAEGGGQ